MHQPVAATRCPGHPGARRQACARVAGSRLDWQHFRSKRRCCADRASPRRNPVPNPARICRRSCLRKPPSPNSRWD